MVMVFAMSVTAFATNVDGGNDGASQKPETGHWYEVYQIFTGDYSNGILSNIKWGQNAKLPEGKKVGDELKHDDSVLEELEEIAKNAKTDSEKLDVINKYADLTGTPIDEGAPDAVNGKITFAGLKPGYYLVKDGGNLVGTDQSYTLYVVQVVNDTLTFEPKVGVPEPDKKILDNGPVDVNEAAIGDTVNYELTGTMPEQIENYKTYSYTFVDTLSKGLTANILKDQDYANGENKLDAHVYVQNGTNEVEVTKYFYTGATKYDAIKGTTITVSIEDVKALANVEGIEITKNTKIVVRYGAVLNENAVIGAANPNDVKLEYTNNPNQDGQGSTEPPKENPEEPVHPDGITPTITVETYTTELAILKTNESKEVLPGTKFELSGDGVKISYITEEKFEEDPEGTYWKLKNGSYTLTAPTTAEGDTNNEADYESSTVKYKLVRTISPVTSAASKVEAEVQADGRVVFTGLGEGTYTLKETNTLPGYNTIDDITFTITFNRDDNTFSTNSSIISVGANNTLQSDIVNHSGSLLPSTGGIGTTIFYVVGGILVIGAGILLVTKRRMKAQ